MTFYRTLVVGAIAIFVALGLIIVLAAPADAHESSVYQGDDAATVGELHEKVGAFDRECDGHAVTTYAKVNIKVGGTHLTSTAVTDSNGCEPGGSWRDTDRDVPGTKVIKIQVCEYNDDTYERYCSPWKDIRH